MTTHARAFGSKASLKTAQGVVAYYRLHRLEELGLLKLERLPVSIRILLENVLRHAESGDGLLVRPQDVENAAGWNPKQLPDGEVPFMPARVLLQDFTGVPCVVDLAAMRTAMKRMGGDPKRVNPGVPCDLVIDHSVQVDFFGTNFAFERNVGKEYERNGERYALLRWAQSAYDNFRVVPPGTGICHQVNLEYLASVVATRKAGGETMAFPDTLVGTDSHTTMINGLSVLGWGVGGIEAEAVMLGQPYSIRLPEVVGFKLTGQLPEGATATDLVLTVTEMLRKKGVVEKFVEFYGTGLSRLPLPDRATIANMAPEYGATVGFFPIDQETLAYLRGTDRSPEALDLVERYAKEQGLFRTDATPDPQYTDSLALDLGTVVPSLAGPRRPQDRVPLRDMRPVFRTALTQTFKKPAPPSAEGQRQTTTAVADRPTGVEVTLDGQAIRIDHGAVVIAAITSCTNTSNPSVMVGAGLIAKKALELGLRQKPWVKTSMAPGSRVVESYLRASGLLPYLEQLGFNIVGFGCTTCIGNSGPLPEPVSQAVAKNDLVVAAVLSGNRNFEGRIHPQVKANYLASPMLVVAYALAGTVDIDLQQDPLGAGCNGQPVYLRDLWPSQDEVRRAVAQALKPEMFRERYSEVFHGDDTWRALPVPTGDLYAWDAKSTYVQHPPYFEEMPPEPHLLQDVKDAHVLLMLADSITTDHISPAGSIPADRPAGLFLIQQGVNSPDFNTFGARRGNHLVMVRGTFGNIRLRNELTPDREGDWTVHFPSGQAMSIYDASVRYQQERTPLVVLAGKEYGSGSSRDWAAKGPFLLGVKAVIAESYERIHRSNLVGMGVLPLQFMPGEGRKSLGLTGNEMYDVTGAADLTPGKQVTVSARRPNGPAVTFKAIARVNTPVEVEYLRHGGVLQYVLRRMLRGR
ncbi:MAG: aconitate hydratase AcnA [Dehalococcoidia bacterium]|nr:aconitate hydratase AcnA [Dehalococcoidia bacterium]